MTGSALLPHLERARVPDFAFVIAHTNITNKFKYKGRGPSFIRFFLFFIFITIVITIMECTISGHYEHGEILETL